MSAVINDQTRITATIACSGSVTANPITNATLRTALGYGSNEPCTIGSSDGLYTQFQIRVDTGGGRTWSFGVDYIGDGTYTTLKTGLANGAAVTIGIRGGAFSDGTVTGACRPFAFLVTTSAANAADTISIAAIRSIPT